MFVAGPSDVGACPSIASFRPGSAAQRSDQLAPGDRVRSVNGINTTRMRPDELASLLDNVLADTATLEVEYNMPEYSTFKCHLIFLLIYKTHPLNYENILTECQ